MLVHTPHLVDKYQGTRMILDMLRRSADSPRACVHRPRRGAHDSRCARMRALGGDDAVSDHQCTPARAADMIETYGSERIMVNSAGDWGHSDPLAVPEFIFEMRRRGQREG